MTASPPQTADANAVQDPDLNYYASTRAATRQTIAGQTRSVSAPMPTHQSTTAAAGESDVQALIRAQYLRRQLTHLQARQASDAEADLAGIFHVVFNAS